MLTKKKKEFSRNEKIAFLFKLRVPLCIDCSTAVEHTPRKPEVVGLNALGGWDFSFSSDVHAAKRREITNNEYNWMLSWWNTFQVSSFK